MKWLLIFWAVPLALLGSWYTLSYYDVSFGTMLLSRDMHDLVFVIYGQALGMAPEDVPPLVLKAIVVDTALVAGLIMLKRRSHTIGSALRALFRRVRRGKAAEPEEAQSEASLSSAP